MALTLRTVNLATLIVGSFFYGLYCVLFFISLYLLFLRRSTHNSSQPTPSHGIHKRAPAIFRSFLFTTAILLFATVTCHWIIIVYRAFLAFGSEGDAEAFYDNNKHITFLLLDIFLAVVTVIGDLLILYRLWIVWSKSTLVVVLPICCMLLFTAVGGVSTNVIKKSNGVFSDPWLTVNIVCTFITNLYCTVFIAWRIWRTTRMTISSDNKLMNFGPQKFLTIVVESAAIYALWVIFFGVLYEVKSILQSFAIETGPAIIGIVNALILTRIGLSWTSEPDRLPSTQLIFAALSQGNHGDSV
ncbi:hypothetical protein MVEN_01630100 [Mycena venus]|uniref:Uncharacterized protein n=1 Tax=Mycena venus TaxID=2733690 RepID=A0A8H7CQM8_9AGAR|nr:hypothetical protein MVEN_01630100 [Mycena venus]